MRGMGDRIRGQEVFRADEREPNACFDSRNPTRCATYSLPKKERGRADVSTQLIYFINIKPAFCLHSDIQLPLSLLHHDPPFRSSSDEEAESKPPRLNVPRPIHRSRSHPFVPRRCQRRGQEVRVWNRHWYR